MSKKKRNQAAFPKEIGGLKVPKHLRRAAAKLGATAASPAGLELIAAGLSLAAAAVAKERARQQGAVAARHGADDGGARLAENVRIDQAGSDPHEVGVVLGKMAEAALAGLFKRRS